MPRTTMQHEGVKGLEQEGPELVSVLRRSDGSVRSGHYDHRRAVQHHEGLDGWPAISELLGGRFGGHPITGDLPITVVDADHPATAHLPSPWHFRDELYLFRDLVPDARVLLAVDIGATVRLPLAWCLERPPMRTFYTALGHFVAAYENADYLEHVRGGIEWVLQGSGS